jgi:hypothetical protein
MTMPWKFTTLFDQLCYSMGKNIVMEQEYHVDLWRQARLLRGCTTGMQICPEPTHAFINQAMARVVDCKHVQNIV